MGYLEDFGGHLSFYAVGFRATLGLAAFFSWNESLILIKAFGAAGFFAAFFLDLALLGGHFILMASLGALGLLDSGLLCNGLF